MTRKTIAFLVAVLVVACSSNPVVQVGGGQDPPLSLDPVEGGGSPEGSVPSQDAGRDSRTSDANPDANPEDSSVDSSLDAATDSPSSDSSTDSSSDAAADASGSDGGADASGDAGIDAAPTCVSATRCAGKVPQTCGVVDGGVVWESQAACTFDCLDGRCIECSRGSDCTLPSASFCVDGTCRECNPGSVKCSSVGQNRQKCSMGGAWEVVEICPFACLPSSVRCDGKCVPGTRRCNPVKIDLGGGVLLDSTQECDQGVWVDQLRCNAGSTCSDVAGVVTCRP
jgi:hypothetical protein